MSVIDSRVVLSVALVFAAGCVPIVPSARAHGLNSGLPRLPDLVDQADAVVVGVFQAIPPRTEDCNGSNCRPILPENTAPRIATLSVDFLVKGQASGTIEIVLGSAYQLSPDFLGKQCVVFLKHWDDATWSFVHDAPVLPALPVSVADIEGATALDRTVNLLVAMSLSGKGTRGEMGAWMEMLSSTGSPRATEVIVRNLDDPFLRDLAAALLLRSNTVEAFQAAASVLSAEGTDSSTKQTLTAWIAHSKPPVAAVPALADLARSTDPSVRAAAISALGSTKSRSAIRALAEALQDSDVAIRYQAIVALGKIANESQWAHLPETDYRKKEDWYLPYWLNWVKENPEQ